MWQKKPLSNIDCSQLQSWTTCRQRSVQIMPISALHSYLLYNDYWSSATSNYLICVPQNVFKNMCIITILIDFIKLLNKKSFYNFITLILFYKIMYVKIYSFVFFEEEKEEETIWSHVYLHKMSIFCIRHRSNLLKLYFSYFFLAH